MRIKLVVLTFLFCHNFCSSQVTTILDSLDNPIAITFVGDDMYVLLHGRPKEGKLISFNIYDPSKKIKVHLDGLTYPRAIIQKDSIIYIGLPSSIITYDLKLNKPEFKVYISNGISFPRSFVFVGDELYYAGEEGLARIYNSSNRRLRIPLSNLVESPLSILLKGKDIYMASGTSIFTYNYSTRRTTEIIKDLEYRPYSILCVDDFLYMDNGDLSKIENIIAFNLKNLDSGYDLIAQLSQYSISLIEHKGSIYFASQSASFTVPKGRIMRIDKSLLTQPKVNDLSIFPNPTTSIFRIETLYKNDMNYRLYDSSGQLIFSGMNLLFIDMAEYPDGVYHLSFENMDKNITGMKKIIKID